MSQTRRLAAILASDVAGYLRLIGCKPSGRYEPSSDYVNQSGLKTDQGSKRI